MLGISPRSLSLFASLAIVALVVIAAQPMLEARGAGPGDPLRVRVTLGGAAAAGIAELGLTVPVTGRVYVILTRDGSSEPRLQTDVRGVPFWGMDVRDLAAGGAVVLDASAGPATGAPGEVIGFPLASLADVPAGQYWMQAVLNVYTRFERADGHVVDLHLNAGEGQQPMRAPGNVISTPQRVRIDPAAGGTIELTLSAAIPPIEPLLPGEVLQQGNPRDGALTKFVKIRSQVLSEFWGRDMYIGANVLLPRDYDSRPAAEHYPTLYMQGHFPGRSAPLGYGGRRGGDFTAYWDSAAPRMAAVSIRDANPYYDTSYSVDSANVGPYGTAITQELIPYLEERFRLVPEGWARLTAGGSTGGWEALAAQVLYPETFGGSWAWCPDPVDFRYYQIVNVYDDDNAFYLDDEWHRVERPNTRRTDGNVTTTMRQENLFELAMGTRSRSAGQWAIWEAVFSPVAPDGYPAAIWDPRSGAIDAEVASYWRERWDMRALLQRDWKRLAPLLRGKLHFAVGDMDTYYLEQAVYLLQEFLVSAQPPADATFEFGRRKPHCWIGASHERPGEDLDNAEFVRQVAAYLDRTAPAGATRSWR